MCSQQQAISSLKGENERLRGKLSSTQQQLQEALSTHGQLLTPCAPITLPGLTCPSPVAAPVTVSLLC